MKIVLLTLLLLLTTSLNITAQNLIAVQNGGTPTFYSKLTDAVTNSQIGDTIYIPGGSFENIIINKKLHLIGVGHNPDSTKVTNISQIGGKIELVSGADGGSISGLRICELNFGTSSTNQNINNFTVSRCWIGVCSLGFLTPSSAASNSFIENIIHLINGKNAENNIFLNNIIGYAYSFISCTFKNNIFLEGYQSCSIGGFGSILTNIFNSTFENNIIYSIGDSSYNIFNNNLFFNGISSTNSVYLNNLMNQNQSSTFINKNIAAFDYTDDYHLKSTSLGKNAGKDGTDIGIYGGAFPWKEGSIPFNPHFQAATIAPKTDASGNLNIQIKVSAQDN